MEFAESRIALPWSEVCTLIAVLLLAAVFWTPYGVPHLDLSRFGKCEDVQEAIARDTYVAKCYLPHQWQMFVLHILSVMSLLAAFFMSRVRVLVVFIFMCWMGSFGLHLLGWGMMMFGL